MKNKIVLITGSTDGIGKQTALELAQKGAEIIIHGRNEGRVEATVSEIKKTAPDVKISGYTADFTSLQAVSDFADKLNRDFNKIDILFNNAAVFSHQYQLTEDGYELNFQVNYLSHILLIFKILPLLKKAKHARVVNISSMIHAADIDLDNLQSETNYSGSAAYSLSKLLNILFTNKAAREFADSNINFYALHPGVIETKLLNAAWSGGFPLSEGARNLIYVAESPALAELSGVYIESGRPVASNPVSYNEDIQDELWIRSKKMLDKYL